MVDIENLQVTVELFLEIRDAEMYGGIGSVGYASSSISGGYKMLHKDYKSYITKQKQGFASLYGVSEECIRLITKEEYELSVEDD